MEVVAVIQATDNNCGSYQDDSKAGKKWVYSSGCILKVKFTEFPDSLDKA